MEYALVNPRHRRHRRKRARARRRTITSRRRRRVNGLYAANPRRRRHVRRHHRRAAHRRHNPRFGGGLMAKAQQGLSGVMGYAVTNIATAALVNNMPGIPATLKSGLPRTALKAVVGGIALPFILKKTPLKGFAGAVAAGAWIAVGIDLYNAYVEGNLPANLKDYGDEFGASLHDYQAGQLMDYQPGTLMDDEARGGAELSGSVYEGGPYE
jgi:hypothetical protein